MGCLNNGLKVTRLMVMAVKLSSNMVRRVAHRGLACLPRFLGEGHGAASLLNACRLGHPETFGHEYPWISELFSHRDGLGEA